MEFGYCQRCPCRAPQSCPPLAPVKKNEFPNSVFKAAVKSHEKRGGKLYIVSLPIRGRLAEFLHDIPKAGLVANITEGAVRIHDMSSETRVAVVVGYERSGEFTPVVFLDVENRNSI